MAVDSDGSLLVTEIEAGTLLRVRADGTRATVASGLTRPYAVAVGGDGTTWVIQADGALRRVGRGGTVSTLPLRLSG